MTRSDYTVVADILVKIINAGYVKKKDIDKTIGYTSNKLSMNYTNFMSDTFEQYVKDKIW